MSNKWTGICHDNNNDIYERECKLITFNNMKIAQKFMKNLKFNNPHNNKLIKLYNRVTNRKKITTQDGKEFYCDSLRKQHEVVPRSYAEVINQISKKHISNKTKHGKKTFHHSNYFVGYLKPPKLENGKWVGGNNNTLRVVVPLPLLCNFYHDCIPLLHKLDDYSDYITKEREFVLQNFSEKEYFEYMEFVNVKYDTKLEFVEDDDDE